MAAENKYGHGAVYGSLAYDAGYPELYGDETYAELRAKAAAEARSRTGAHTAARSRQGIAPFSVIGILVAAFLFVTAMTARTRLLDLSSEGNALEAEIAELETEQARLRIVHETTFNLAEVEEYATGVLGMQAPQEDQIAYIDVAAPDRAAVIAEKNNDGFVDHVSDLLVRLGAYFAWSGE